MSMQISNRNKIEMKIEKIELYEMNYSDNADLSYLYLMQYISRRTFHT